MILNDLTEYYDLRKHNGANLIYKKFHHKKMDSIIDHLVYTGLSLEYFKNIHLNIK